MAPKPEIEFIRACSNGRLDTLKQLISSGLSPETKDKYGLTGLIWAGRKGQIDVAKILLEAGADIDGKDRRGRTALSHAVAFKRHVFVQFLVTEGAFLDPVDAHGWTPLDIASMPLNAKMVEILKRLGAQRKSTQEPPPDDESKPNKFYWGGGIGGPDLPIEVKRIHIQLGTAMYKWRGHYTDAIKFFAFAAYVDASLVRFTEQMNILGPQRAKRKRDWVEVRIGVPESWWREEESVYKQHIVDSVEEGFHSMIALLRRNRHAINAEALLADWSSVRKEFLETKAPPFPAEAQHVAISALVDDAKRAPASK